MSAAAAAQRAGVPTWVVLAWVRQGMLHETREDGRLLIRRQELDTLLALYRPATAVAA